jgi:hypothetical protein
MRKVLMALALAFMLIGCAQSASSPQAGVIAVATPSTAAAIVGVGTKSFDHSTFDKILGTYVSNGRFDYAGLKANAGDQTTLQNYLDSLGSADASKLSKPEQFAFWVNAYNAFNIKAVTDHYPVVSPKDIDGYFDKLQYKVSGVNMTLNDMEYVQLVPGQNDARAHFVVVCSDLGSMPLENHAYTAANLNGLLDEKTKQFVADPKNFDVDMANKVVYASKLFDWYGEDFTKDPKFSGNRAVEYLAPYVPADQAAFLHSDDYKVVFIDWDWSLNGAEKA